MGIYTLFFDLNKFNSLILNKGRQKSYTIFSFIFIEWYLRKTIINHLNTNFMSFTGNENHDIPLSTASQWTKNYREASGSGATLAHFFGKAAIQAILNQPNCVGIRMYYALDPDGKKQLILVGTDAAENDLVNGLLAERSTACPPICSNSNPLNS